MANQDLRGQDESGFTAAKSSDKSFHRAAGPNEVAIDEIALRQGTQAGFRAALFLSRRPRPGGRQK